MNSPFAGLLDFFICTRRQKAGCCCDFSKARRGWASSYRGRRPAGPGRIVEAHEVEHVGGFAAKLERKPFSKLNVAEETLTARIVVALRLRYACS